MGIFDRLKKRNKQISDSHELTFQLGETNGLIPMYYAGISNAQENEAAASCIQTNATYCSKVEFQSVRISKNDEKFRDYPKLDKLLQISPNPLMTAAVFWERTANYYFTYNNAFIYIERDNFGEIVALWSLNPNSVKYDRLRSGDIIFNFTLNGIEREVLYSDMIHICRHVTESVMFGSKKANDPIAKVVDLINLSYTGMEQAILTSAAIRFLGKMNTKLNDDELKRRAKIFTDQFLKLDGEKVGIAFHDSSLDVTPVNAGNQKTANYEEVNQWNKAVYKFFGCPEKIIEGTATENEMDAYYERTIEPFLLRAAQEMTRKIFTDREYDFGNRIVFSDKALKYLSMKTRLEIFRTAREIGCFTLGTLGDLIGLPVANDMRDVVAVSQNYNDSVSGQTEASVEENPSGGDEDE